MADILPSDKRRQPPKTKGNPINIIEQETKRTELRKIDAEIAKIIADAHKINAESVKIAQESRWYPMMAASRSGYRHRRRVGTDIQICLTTSPARGFIPQQNEQSRTIQPLPRMDYRARRRKPFHYPLPLSPPDCQNPQADRRRMPGRALPPFRKRHHPLRFYFFRRQTGRRSPICRRPYRNLPPGSQKNRVCTRLADMLPSKYEDNTLQIKERSTKRTAPFFCTGSYRPFCRRYFGYPSRFGGTVLP